MMSGGSAEAVPALLVAQISVRAITVAPDMAATTAQR
jgi:hypothetical protein